MKSSMYLQHPATSRILKFPLVGETTRISFVAVEQDHFAQKNAVGLGKKRRVAGQKHHFQITLYEEIHN